jgi:hypothetical protein
MTSGWQDVVCARPRIFVIIREAGRLEWARAGSIYIPIVQLRQEHSYRDQQSGSPTSIMSQPGPHHGDPLLRTLPHSSIRVHHSSNLIGTASKNLLFFLSSASQVSKA